MVPLIFSWKRRGWWISQN